jgi:hypothetical protein
MTVFELIELLKMVPGDSMVVIPGYEDGFDNPKITSGTIVPDANWNGESKNIWYEGRHASVYSTDHIPNNAINCVIIQSE